VRRLLPLVVFVFLLPTRAAADLPWIRPVDGPVVKGFTPPTTPYGPGHLGVHFAVPPGTSVRAANGGIVTFAGTVAGALDVVILHEGGLRTTYAFLATTTVHAGESVVRGQVIGTTGGRGPGHNGDVLHFGLRRGDVYLDPMVLFGPTDVHLAPLH
jgi:murein DD-endopeptidase MepM/ murein hydrolase activator NlpD